MPGSSNVRVTLSWAPRSCGVTNLCQLAVAQWNGSQWNNNGNGGTTGSFLTGTVITGATCSAPASVTAFGPFTLASTSNNNPLPVELVSFEATARPDHVDLKWVTAGEMNNDHFVVEKTRDEVAFEEVVQVTGAGNSQSSIVYSEIDPDPWPGISYYRLRQVDFDGTSTLSDLVAVEYVTMDNILLYPNPYTGDELWIEVMPAGKGLFEIECLDASGRRVAQWRVDQEEGRSRIDLRPATVLGSGSYTIRVHRDGRTFAAPLIVL